MAITQNYYTLNNGLNIPKVGFGTWQLQAGKETYDSVLNALKVGYRHIDTAQTYWNEESVGQAVKDSSIPREEIFITTKLATKVKDYQGTIDAFHESLKKLQVDYIDLFLIHAPWSGTDRTNRYKEGNIESYKAMETLYNEGKIKAIGISNFDVEDTQNILDNTTIIPQVNQIAYFIGLKPQEVIEFCHQKGILIEAYSPLGVGHLLDNPTINQVAKQYDQTPAQICLRYLLQKGTLPLPKSAHKQRMIENLTLDFTIEPQDMALLDAIDEDPR